VRKVRLRSLRFAAIALLFAVGSRAALAQSTPAPNPTVTSLLPGAPLSPNSLFARTFARLETYPIPPYVIYTTRWHMQSYSMGQPPQYDVLWRYAIREADDLENAASPQSEEWLPQAGISKAYLGLFASILRPPAPITSSPTDDTSGLKVIAVVAATRVDYRIDLVGTERIDGRLTNHLRLTPLGDPLKYNLRDLWSDAETFDLRRARFIIANYPGFSNFTGAAMTVNFGPALQYWIVLHESWTAGSPRGTHSFDVTTLRVAFPPELPDWIFDQSAYDRRQRTGAPDLLQNILDASKSPS
jgi:hypothetical protein